MSSGTAQPPVNEVVLAVAVSRRDGLMAPRLPGTLGSWYTRFPDIQAVPPYHMPEEPRPGRGENPMLSLAQRFEGAFMTPLPRYWLTAPGQPYLIQVQNDYIAVNWRRRTSREVYIRYPELRETFVSLVETVAASLESAGETLIPTCAEVTYVNVIEPGDRWRQLGDLGSLLRVQVPGLADADAVSFATAKPLFEQGHWKGRLHVSLQSARDWVRDEPRLLLDLTARSATGETTIEQALAFLDFSHGELNSTFLSLLTNETLAAWHLAASDDNK